MGNQSRRSLTPPPALQRQSTIQCHQPPARDPGFDLSGFGGLGRDPAPSFLGGPQEGPGSGLGAEDTALLTQWLQTQGQGSDQPAAPEAPALETPDIVNRMAEVAAMDDGVARNLEITDLYAQTSTMLDKAMFRDPAEQGKTANWNTFAVWASNEAGRAIRGEGNWMVGLANAIAPQSMLDNTSDALASGNREVFAEIAPASAMFAHTFGEDAERDPKKFAQFEEWMRTEAPNRDELLGNEGLIDAFRVYHEAMFETDPDRKQELMFQANAKIGLHEQTRLQPFIEDAMPWGARGLITANSMFLHTPTNDEGPAGLNFDQNYDALNLSGEVRDQNWYGGYTEQYPDALKDFQDRGTQRTWDGIDTHWWSNPTVGAENWANFDDRMTYIGELFRSKQNDPRLHNQPFTQEQKEQKLRETGRTP